MGSNVLERRQPTVQYDAGRTKKVSLPREHYFEYLDLVLYADVEIEDETVAERNGNGILDLVEQIKVEYNGSKTPKSQSFAMSHLVDYYEYGSRPLLQQVDFDEAGEQEVKAQTFCQFLLEPRHLATPLPSFLFSTLDLEIKWGDASDVGEGIEINDAEIKIESRERKRGSIANEDRVLDNLMVFKETEMSQDIRSTGETTIDLPQGNVYHSIPTLIVDDGTPSDSLVDSIQVVENGVDTHFSVDFDMQQADDFAQYSIEEPVEGFALPGYSVGADIDDAVDTTSMDSYKYFLDTGDQEPQDAYAQVLTRELIL